MAEPNHHVAVFVAEGSDPNLEAIVEELRRIESPFFGGLFPGLIVDGERQVEGALLLSLPSEAEPLLVTGLDRPPLAFGGLEDIASTVPESRTAMVLVDGLAANVSLLLTELHERLGHAVHYVGGGAGSLNLVQRPCVFTREGVFQDAAVVSFVSQRSRLGVRHGWKFLEGPLIATRTEGNVVKELNWQPAFEVYRTAIRPYLDKELTEENFFRESTAFPFGIYKEDLEDVVRDPVSIGPEGELVCVGEVPENAVLNILRGNRESLIHAAAKAAEDCVSGERVESASAFVVDCVSRTMFLEEDFCTELSTVRDRLGEVASDLEVDGLLTLGEISSHGQGFVEFFNKTIVIAVLHD